MAKIDFKKQLKEFYAPPTSQVVLVEVPEMSYLMVDGHGDPNKSPMFAEAIEAMYSVAYTIKFAIKKADPEKEYEECLIKAEALIKAVNGEIS